MHCRAEFRRTKLGQGQLGARVTRRTPTLDAPESSDQRSNHVLLPPVDKRRRLAPRHTGGEPAMQNDTDGSAQPTLWGEVPQPRAPGARSPMVCAGTRRLRKSANSGRSTRSPLPRRSEADRLLLAIERIRAGRLLCRQAPALARIDGDRMDGGARAPEVTAEDDIQRSCPRCGESIQDVRPKSAGRPRRWCSANCRRAASEERRAAAAGAIATKYVQADVSLDDHVQAVLASPAACRRIVRDLRERYDAGMLSDARWSPVAEELQRTRSLPRPTIRWGAR